MFASLSAAPRPSPPLTPPQTLTSDGSGISPASSDDSSCLELSFVYEVNSQGEVVRVSKDLSKSSAPPTPDQSPKLAQASPPKAPSPIGQLRAPSLGRSESLPASAFEPTPSAPARSFQRVASGPLQTPASSSSIRSSIAPLSTGGRKLGGARRVKLEEFQEQDVLLRSQPQAVDEKENARGPSHNMQSSRPMIPIRPTRLLNKKSGIDKIVEDQAAEEHAAAEMRGFGYSGRPRRSASLSDASASGSMSQDSGYEQGMPNIQYYQSQYQRPGTSLGMAGRGARRVTIEEKRRQERESALEEGYARREAEEAAEAARRAQSSSRHHSPSPTHIASHARPAYSHQRKDSDTLRSAAALTPTSPTAVEFPSRVSPPNRNYVPSSAPSLVAAAATNLRHRRSPTAPEAPTSSAEIAPPNGGSQAAGRTWAAGDSREQEREERYDSAAPSRNAPAMPPPQPPAPPPAKQQQVSHPQASYQGTPALELRSRNMVVNKKAYARLDMIGKGGSSRVYRVMNGTNEIFAIKRVSLDKTDADTMSGYMNEIALLKRLEGNSRIIRLIDSELKPGPGGSMGHLMLVMECGEIDLARLLQEQQKEPLDLVWIAYYWKQMLQAVHIIHEEKIVHSDLKPANFVLVRGQLKLIDFGIANAIANDTTNIQRDHQIGTVNYMSPEAIELPEGMRRLKVGRPSDVWSLGCILYQMVYGQPPFQHLSVYQKMKAIPNEKHIIEFPHHATPSVPSSRASSGEGSPHRLDHLSVRVPETLIATMQSCLARNPKERMTIPALLDQDWLEMKAPPPPLPPSPPPPPSPILKEDETIINPHFMQQLLAYGISLGMQGRDMDNAQLLREAERLVNELRGVQAASQ